MFLGTTYHPDVPADENTSVAREKLEILVIERGAAKRCDFFARALPLMDIVTLLSAFSNACLS
jgi:hypothetical protein